MRTHRRFGPIQRRSRYAAVVAALTLTIAMLDGVVAVRPTHAQATPVTAAPDEASALAAARASGRRVEVLSERTETAEVYANPSGTFTLEQHNQPQRVRRGGSWVAIDTTLHARADGSVAAAATVADVVFSGGGDGPLVRARYGNREVGLGWRGRLPAPVLDGAVARYAEVLPGVDLTVRALASGFSHALVVKSPQAAKNPLLRRLSFSVLGQGLSLRKGSSGSLAALDSAGEVVMSAGTPRMWEAGDSAGQGGPPAAASAGPARQAAMAVETAGNSFSLLPDRGLLEDPGARFPLVIDPVWNFGRLAWTSVWKRYRTTSYWNMTQIDWTDPDKGVVRAGYETNEGQTVRSLFRMDTAALRPTEVIRATFRITESWAWSCSPRWVDLYLTGPINENTTWDRQPVWIRPVGNAWAAKGYEPGGCGDGPVELDATSAVREAADGDWTDVTLGLRGPSNVPGGDEVLDPYTWKRFRLDPVLIVEFNSYPNPPGGLYADINLPCATGAGRPVTNTSPTLFATGSDPDGGNVEVDFELWNTGGSYIASYPPPPRPFLASGSRFSAVIPTSVLGNGRAYSWRARAGDGRVWGPWSGWCEFSYDTTAPTALPTVSSTSFPENGTGVPVGARGEFTFTSADPDVYGYRYGLTESTSYFVAAGTASDRAATVPVTMWTDAPSDLYVYSVDRAGNRSQSPVRYHFAADEASAPPAHVRGDVNGDALADVAAVQQRDADESAFITFASRGSGFYEPVRTWESGPNTKFLLDRMQPVSGDFNGDGRSDMAVLRDEGDAGITVWVFRANGVGYDAPAAPAWSSGAHNWVLHAGRTVAGDINGDGRDDLVNFHAYANQRMRIWAFYGTATGVAAPVMIYDSGDGGWDWNRSKEVAGDFNGDGRDDIAAFYNYFNAQTAVWVFYGTATGVAAPAMAWSSAVGGWDWNRGSAVAGDFNGDGRDDIAAFYNYFNAQTKLWIFSGRALSAPAMVWDSGPGNWEWGCAKAVAKDLNGDGRSDLIAAYGYPSSDFRRTKLFVWEGNASTWLGPPAIRWDSGEFGLDWTRTSFH